MNYGRYFKLNQVVSKVVESVTVYDYIDLPAFFGPSADTPQTPKFPISVTITSDAVLFRVHYSCFKIENEKEPAPEYRMHLDDILTLDKPGWSLSTVHLEEIIMELPFVDTYRLAENIREVYSTLFPMPMGKTDSNNYGGRFFFKLLEKRYQGKVDDEESVERKMYENLRKNAQSRLSYSQIAEMGTKDEHIYKERENVTIFLRKLLLDFMFDLHHSDIFRLNPHYCQMLTGLMSDYYFAALMHKCEYYYQRDLVYQYIKDNRNEQNCLLKVSDDKKTNLVNLYCKDFFKAEDNWLHNILDPRSEREFDTGEKKMWFEPPEEEMKKIFLNDNKVSLSVDELINDYKLRKNKAGQKPDVQGKELNSEVREMVARHDRNREAASRWFLQRYDFVDVLRLHFFPAAPCLFFSIVFVICVTFSIPAIPILIPIGIGVTLFLTLLVMAVLNIHKRQDSRNHFIACLHIFMPRMVAAISTAWLTIALCYELVVSVFARGPAWVVILLITVVLAVFVLHKINLCIPRVESRTKEIRTMQLLLLSYFISAIVGIVIVACVGEPFMIEHGNMTISARAYAFDDTLKASGVQEYMFEKCHLVFVLRKLTITFSFVAMFIGIFIQLIIGEEKQMTEL